MAKGVPQKRYAVKFKKLVVETMRKENLSCTETAERFGIRYKRVQDWERIYLTEGPEGFAVERRGRASTGRPRKVCKETEEDLIAENQRLRAEVAYLKNLQALVLERATPAEKTQVVQKLARLLIISTACNRSTASCHLLLPSKANEECR